MDLNLLSIIKATLIELGSGQLMEILFPEHVKTKKKGVTNQSTKRVASMNADLFKMLHTQVKLLPKDLNAVCLLQNTLAAANLCSSKNSLLLSIASTFDKGSNIYDFLKKRVGAAGLKAALNDTNTKLTFKQKLACFAISGDLKAVEALEWDFDKYGTAIKSHLAINEADLEQLLSDSVIREIATDMVDHLEQTDLFESF